MIVECPACESRYDVTGRPPGTKARCRCGQIFELPAPAQSASALACPKCGGNVASGSSTCGFCEAALLVKACPRCFARIFHGAKHCDQCGATVDVPANVNADGTAKCLACPRCDASPTMIARLVGDTLLDECPGCHGVWLDAAGVDRLVRERRQTSTEAVLGMGGPARTGVLPVVPPGRMYVKCPECETIMNRANFAKRSGIIIDTCRGHGTWFDADELPRIVEFVMNGGIEAANEARLEQLRDEARREKSNARSERMRSTVQGSGVGMAGFHGGSRNNNVNAFTGILGLIGGALLG